MSRSQNKSDTYDEESLINSVLSGCINDFEKIVLQHQGAVFNMILRQVRDESVAKDLAQDTFLRAYRGLKTFKGRATFSTWLTRIALNVTNSYFQSRKFKEQQSQVSLEVGQVERIASPEGDLSDQMVTLALLQKSIALLKPKYREVLVLCSLENKTYEQAAQILQIPLGTVCSRMNTALTYLRKTFSQYKTQGTL